MRQYQICIDSAGVYPMGLTPTEKGIHVSVAAAAKECSLLLFSPEKGSGKNQISGSRTSWSGMGDDGRGRGLTTV